MCHHVSWTHKVSPEFTSIPVRPSCYFNPVVEPCWIVPAVDLDVAKKLAAQFSLPAMVTQVLVA
jgi:hypothetical protein